MESADGLRQLLDETTIMAESERARKLLKYHELLVKWNDRVNLTASSEWQSLKPFFLEGIWASKKYPPEAKSHLDIGSGAGFPAIILRILVPRIKLELVESRGKKGAFLETVIHALGLENTSVHTERLGTLLQRYESKKIWDCISWKGIKLRTRELQKLLRHANADTQFWMFHGRGPAVGDAEALQRYFRLLGREKSGGERDWILSIYKAVRSQKKVP